MTAAEIRALFPRLEGTIYLNTATMAVGSEPARQAFARAVDRWCAGRFDWLDAERAGENARAMFASIIGAPTEDVAILPTVSTAVGLVAAN